MENRYAERLRTSLIELAAFNVAARSDSEASRGEEKASTLIQLLDLAALLEEAANYRPEPEVKRRGRYTNNGRRGAATATRAAA